MIRRLSGAVASLLIRAGASPDTVAETRRALGEWGAVRRAALVRRAPVFGGLAVDWSRPGAVEIRSLEVACAGRGELTIAIEATVVSPGTERAQYLRLPSARPSLPHRPGYCAAGRIVAVGRGVSGFAVGDLVAAPRVPHQSVASVPAADVYRVPPGVDAARAALTYLAMIAGYGVERAEIVSDEAVCVLGVGPVGALALRLARLRTTGPIVAVAATRRRPGAPGADRYLPASETDQIAGLEAPVVIDATGSPAAVALAVDAAAPGGRVVLLGSPRGSSQVPVRSLRSKRITLIGAHIGVAAHERRTTGADGFRRHADTYLEAVAEGSLDVTDLLGDAFDPREAAGLYRRLAEGSVRAATFDWTLVPHSLRLAERTVLARPRPDLTGRTEERPRAAAVPQRAPATPRQPQPVVRFGVLGCGDIGIANARAIADAPNARLVAVHDVVDSLASDTARQLGGDVCATPEALLSRDDVDAVLISVPHDLHLPLAEAAIRSGKHVVIEKPLATDLAGASRMVEAAREAGVALSPCLPFRYEPPVAEARRLVQAGALGEIHGCAIQVVMDKPASYWQGGYSGRATSDWRASLARSGGGVLIMNAFHYLDWLLFVGGIRVAAVSAVTDVRAGAEVEDVVALTLRFEAGGVGSLIGAASARGGGGSGLRLWGADGQLVLDDHPRLLTTRAIDGTWPGRWHALPRGSGDERTVFVERFARALAAGVEPDVSADAGLAVQALVEAAYRSAAERREVRVADLLGEGVG